MQKKKKKEKKKKKKKTNNNKNMMMKMLLLLMMMMLMMMMVKHKTIYQRLRTSRRITMLARIAVCCGVLQGPALFGVPGAEKEE